MGAYAKPVLSEADDFNSPGERSGVSPPVRYFRTGKVKTASTTVYFNLGRPCGRVVISRPSLLVAVVAHASSPNGEPRLTLRRMEGESATFLAAMVRMLPIEVRYPKKGEAIEEFAVPISTVAKIAIGDPSLKGYMTGPEDPDQILVGLHGLDFSFSYAIEEDKVRLSQYRYLLSQIIDREELPGLGWVAQTKRN